MVKPMGTRLDTAVIIRIVVPEFSASITSSGDSSFSTPYTSIVDADSFILAPSSLQASIEALVSLEIKGFLIFDFPSLSEERMIAL
jgi:hypothetical protein